MINSQAKETLLLFGISNQMVEHDLDRIESEYGMDLNRGHKKYIATDDHYYPQIERSIRVEASQMAPHYEVFYSLERTIRDLVRDVLEESDGEDWWSTNRVDESTRKLCQQRMKREMDTGMSIRSTDPLDFSTFGELGNIIQRNWDLFGGQFTRKKAIERVMANLNTLRGPIAHCSPLAEDEVVRLRLSVRDWFRLME